MRFERPSEVSLLLALAFWICLLPLALILVLPRFGGTTAIGVSFALLAVAVAVCTQLCDFSTKEDQRQG